MGNNDNQQDPALIFPGPIALVAGPGSGKTTRLARRVKHLVEAQNASPDEITVITFTVEAARNMKERLTPPAKEGMPDVNIPLEFGRGKLKEVSIFLVRYRSNMGALH